MEKKGIGLRFPEDGFAVQEIVPAKDLQKGFGVDGIALADHKINEIGKLLWRREGVTEEQFYPRLLHAIELYESLKPVDGAEGMLAMQMVGTHDAALECLRRAALPNQSFEGWDTALKQAHKLMSLYAQQLATLDKHRGKGQQKVTVEHVTVEPGGQAIVGNVETGQSGRQQGGSPSEIENMPSMPSPALERKSEASKKKR